MVRQPYVTQHEFKVDLPKQEASIPMPNMTPTRAAVMEMMAWTFLVAKLLLTWLLGEKPGMA